MNVIVFVLLLLGLICFIAAALGGSFRRVNLLALGLLFWILVPLIAAVQAL